MILADVNVLIYAYRQDTKRHEVCRTWLNGVADGEPRFGISSLALSAVVRITTKPRIYVQPSAVEDAFAFCRALLERPNCEPVEPGERHWSIFERICREANVRGPRVSDAWFAALAIEHGCTWITYDTDFARFPGLDWREPSF